MLLTKVWRIITAMPIKYTNHIILSVFINDFSIFLSSSATYDTRMPKKQSGCRKSSSIICHWRRNLFYLLCGRCRNLPWQGHAYLLLRRWALVSADLRSIWIYLPWASKKCINMINLPTILHWTGVLLRGKDTTIKCWAKISSNIILAGTT